MNPVMHGTKFFPEGFFIHIPPIMSGPARFSVMLGSYRIQVSEVLEYGDVRDGFADIHIVLQEIPGGVARVLDSLYSSKQMFADGNGELLISMIEIKILHSAPSH